MSEGPAYDLAVIGGGINGAGIARDAAGRGLRVLLCEQDDLAAYTSSASSKLVHGGLRYLEHYAFGLVAKSLAEREVLLRAAPHIIWPLRFVMPHERGLRPAWMIRLGLFLYDHLDFGKRRLLPGSCGVRLAEHPAGAALQPAFRRGFEFSDAWAQDARLVVLNAMDAAERGAEIRVRTRCIAAERTSEHWRLGLRTRQGVDSQVEARCLVNAAGPWVSRFLDQVARQPAARALRLVKGSHIVVPKLFDHAYAYLFQNPDGRVIFALPYEQDFTLIGTTEVDHAGEPGQVAINAAETDYLCQAANRCFRRRIGPGDVIWSYAGIRPLVEDTAGSSNRATRDYRLELDTAGAPLLSVFGGKLTTYRKLAEQVMHRLQPLLGFDAPDWTGRGAVLPGGDIDGGDPGRFAARLMADYPWLPAALATRYARSYGSRSLDLLGDRGGLDQLGEDYGAGLHQAELDYLYRQEWARTADDVLWRRGKLGLRLNAAQAARVQAWFDAQS